MKNSIFTTSFESFHKSILPNLSQVVIAIICCFSFSNFSWAHSEKAHVHGSGQVSIAFDGSKGQLLFESPADSTVGFEHKATSPADQKIVKTTLDLIKEKIAEMVHLNPELQCQFKPVEVQFEIDKKSGHAETHSEFSLTCSKSPRGSQIQFNFKKFFPKLKSVDVQIIVDDLQKSLKVTEDSALVDLK